jgi:hypothetical protein
MVWAPKNELSCLLLLGRITTFDIPIATYASISIGIEVLLGMLTAISLSASESMPLAMTSQILHLMGAATGFMVGVAMLKWKWVDCENWDLFSVLKGRNLMTREQLAEEELSSDEAKAKLASLREQMHAKLRSYLASGEVAAALALHRRGRKQFGAAWQPPEEDQIQLIAGLRKAQHWEDTVQTMVEYLKTPQPRAPFVRLALAQVLIEQLSRPRQALKVLARLDPKTLPTSHQKTFAGIQQRAQQAAEEDPFEITADDW